MSEKEKESQSEAEAVASEPAGEDTEVPEVAATAETEGDPETPVEGSGESGEEAGASAEADVKVPEAVEEAEPAEEAEEEEAAEEPEEPEATVAPPKRGKKGKGGKKAKGGKIARKPAVAEEAVEDESETPVDTGPPKRWYVVHTYSGHENKVKENIKKMIHVSEFHDHFGQIIVPTEEVAEMKKGKKTVTTKKFFPSYIIVEMHMSDEARHLVSDIPGVTSFVGTASGPQALSVPEVERILGRMDKKKQTIIPEIPFTLGEHIRIKDGPFSDFTGVIDEINAERGKLKVLVSIFGRETPVELDFLQVENL